MPLRLTGTELSHEVVAAADPPALRARARLSAGDLDGFVRVAAEAAEADRPQQGYTDLVAILEAGLGAVDEQHAHRARTLAAVALAALDALEREPAEPILLNYAGVACYELWILDAAQDLFRAARRLDPALPHLERNLTEVGRRRRGPRPARPLHPAALSIARRAASVARCARPTRGMRISLCMIVRDEAQMLGRCLASVADGVDEMVIVDTGSTDATIDIARLFGARVIEHPWTGSFSEARNVSLEAATGDWLIFLDADEVLADGDAARLREYAGHTWREGLFLAETSFTGELGDGTAINHLALRMFRNRPEHRFTGRIHEQIYSSLPAQAPGRIATTTLRLDHYGYLGDIKRGKEKFARNVELLRRQEAEHGSTPFLHYNLGTEYGGTGDFPAAAQHFASAWSLMERDGTLETSQFGPQVISGLVRALRATGRLDDADARGRTGLDLFADFTDLVWEQGASALTRGEHVAARAQFERCLALGDAPARYAGQAGVGSYLARAALASIALDHEDAPDRAREHLQWCLDHHPDYLGSAAPYVTAGLRCGQAPGRLVAELDAAYGGLTAPVRHAVAGALRRSGFAADAAGQYRELIDSEPHGSLAGLARAALAELQLTAGEFAEAAELAAGVHNDSARAALACRIETCARMATGDLQGAAGALARAGAVGLPEAEEAMFAAWLAVAAGQPPASLQVASVPLLATLMELLLGAGGIDAFHELRGLLAASQLPVRDQRQLLAEAQLRHGHLAGAAIEWMEVCSERPDAPALLGLAEVALRQGMGADALTFATAALELDPGCDAARAVISNLPAEPLDK
jgi:tetratricopeptide (TPR) repeat protein